MRATLTIASPVGPLTIAAEDDAIVALRIGAARNSGATDGGTTGRDDGADIAGGDVPVLAAAAAQLDAYFYCGLRAFDLPLAPAGSAFEQAIWKRMNAIPFGETRSYGELARAADAAAKREGLDAAVVAQAVGQACGRNPIAIIQPCHRVLAAGGRMGGFSAPGGIETKLVLLRHEGAVLL